MKINCDMGESFGIWKMGCDEVIMPYLNMANIACGMHASDPSVMMKTVRLAYEHQVSIGAHPGYADLQGFGRRHIAMAAEDLKALFIYQIGALQAICDSENTTLDYVKPHGALYNSMMKDDEVFMTLLQGLKSLKRPLPLVVMAVPDYQRYQALADSMGIKLWFEAFADRTYDNDGRLVPRTMAGSSLTTLEEIKQQTDQIMTQGTVTTIEGKVIPIKVDTLCIHGDAPAALPTAKMLHQKATSL
ncbi:5-oxoprolinase subunit PxpA [Endozoicomonas sp. 4G]|uniref:5-oxoprolinase subunit PxpA n=1 Tax=Endozoicomonas sp. 4G TaxID=2872754 RepID=UPI0020791055|nr:5-oxoprolinase subunit PxpA [Endozoicomonas sp. 4G]